jgi:hypothetical protein
MGNCLSNCLETGAFRVHLCISNAVKKIQIQTDPILGKQQTYPPDSLTYRLTLTLNRPNYIILIVALIVVIQIRKTDPKSMSEKPL